MSYSSCIHHPERNRFIQLYEWQLLFCQGNHCAALLLAFFAAWHDWKIQHDHYYCKSNNIAEMHGDGRPYSENAYLFFSTEELIEGCMGLYGKKAIQEALNFLVSKKVISIHKNPNPRYHFDKTKYFRFYPEICNSWIDKHYRNVENEEAESTQTIDCSDRAKVANRSGKSGVPSGKNGRPSGEKARYITNTTNNTTNNKNQSINLQRDFSEIEETGCGKPVANKEVQEVIEALAAKGFPEERFQYPDTGEEVNCLMKKGATVSMFERAFDIAAKATQGRGGTFGVRYLVKVVEGLLSSQTSGKKYHPNASSSPPVVRAERRYDSDFSKGLDWMGDLIEGEDEHEFISKS